MQGFVVLISPQHHFSQLYEVMKREGYTSYKELEPAAGCRRFLLIKDSKELLTPDIKDDILNP